MSDQTRTAITCTDPDCPEEPLGEHWHLPIPDLMAALEQSLVDAKAARDRHQNGRSEP